MTTSLVYPCRSSSRSGTGVLRLPTTGAARKPWTAATCALAAQLGRGTSPSVSARLPTLPYQPSELLHWLVNTETMYQSTGAARKPWTAATCALAVQLGSGTSPSVSARLPTLPYQPSESCNPCRVVAFASIKTLNDGGSHRVSARLPTLPYQPSELFHVVLAGLKV